MLAKYVSGDRNDQYNHPADPLSFFNFDVLIAAYDFYSFLLLCVVCTICILILPKLPPTAKTNHMHILNLTYFPMRDHPDEGENADLILLW